MGLSLAQMRSHIYEFYELDTDDVSHGLIDRWASEGFTRISRTRQNWPFYEGATEYDTVSGTYLYEDSDFGGYRSVESVMGPDGALSFMVLRDALEWFQNTDGTIRSGRPQVYSRRGDSFYVFPEPAAAHTLTALGYREPVAFGTSASSEPDLPDELHDVVLMWVKYRTYLHQDDTELAQIEKLNFDETLARYTEDLTATDADLPVIVGGTRYTKNHSQLGVPQPDSDWD